MANILIVSAVFRPEPVVSAKLSEDLANELGKKNKVIVIAPFPTRPFGFKFIKMEVAANYQLINLSSYTCAKSNVIGRLIESFSFGYACTKYIKKNRFTIDQIYMSSWPIFAQYLTVKTAFRYNIPIVTHVQDVYPEALAAKMPILGFLLNVTLMPFDKMILERSKSVIAISEKMKRHLSDSRRIALKKIRVVKNWQDEELYINYEKEQNKDSVKQDLFTFMYMGNIGPVAGVDLLIKSFRKANLIKCQLVIAGSGSKRTELENFVSSNSIARVRFIEVPDGMVPHIQESADIMLLPIKKGAASSSIPSKLPAYMFSKKPIIASVDMDSDSARVIDESCSGWVIEPENIDLLMDLMREVFLSTKSELELRGQNGYNFAMKNFSKRNNLKLLVKTISE